MKFISCLKWINQGAPKKVPEKVTLSKEELKVVLQGAQLAGVNDDHESSDENEESVGATGNVSTENEKTNDMDDYDWDNYDKEDDDDTAVALSGLSVFASNDDDPYMTAKDDEDDSDLEDFNLKEDDNMIVAGQVEGSEGVLKFYIYNKNAGDLYVHHDIMLPTMPLCVEWIQDETNGENLVAVGGMNSEIDVWDVDITEVLEPSCVLGSKKKKKNSSDHYGHSDAVLELAWNKNFKKVLASASADTTVALWDIQSCETVTVIKNFSEKVQSLAWHPYESQHLLTGVCKGETKLIDCRNPDNVIKKWECEGDVEKVAWNHLSPFYCLASTENGFVHYYDVRANKSLWSLSAHSKECTGLSLSSSCPNMLITASLDEEIKVWDITAEGPQFVYKHKAKLGKIFCLECSPDHPFVICGGGDKKGNNLKVIDIIDYAAVQKRFEGRQLANTKTSNNNNNGENGSELNVPETKRRKLM
ncbi:rRNA-processing protein [Chamberlinius hualienensis]